MSPSGRGLIIVNADDWGYDEATTAAISDCYRAGGLTSTTAMLFMEDSARAAAHAKDHPGLGIGLHLNLVEEYSDPKTPPAVRDRQRRLIEYSRLLRLRRWVYDPSSRHAVNRVIADQFQRFVDLYGRMPTHLDGHHHCHLAANVLLSPAVPTGTKIRNALEDKHLPNPITDTLRWARARMIARRFTTTDRFLSVETFWPDLQGLPPTDGFDDPIAAPTLEVMVHPAFPHEYGPLQSREWVEALKRLPVGTFEDLR
ncbi:MAG TPA: ChbG/HpnK family deacetylase [Solirubrobacterales bacterium]